MLCEWRRDDDAERIPRRSIAEGVRRHLVLGEIEEDRMNCSTVTTATEASIGKESGCVDPVLAEDIIVVSILLSAGVTGVRWRFVTGVGCDVIFVLWAGNKF